MKTKVILLVLAAIATVASMGLRMDSPHVVRSPVSPVAYLPMITTFRRPLPPPLPMPFMEEER